MLKKFSGWAVLLLAISIGLMVFVHWTAIQQIQSKTGRIQTIFERQKTVSSLTLGLEKYRRMSGSFRKHTPHEVDEIKSRLRNTFSEGVAQLEKLDSSPEEKAMGRQLSDQLADLLKTSAQIEPTLFSQDAYVKPSVQEIHESILATLKSLEKGTQARVQSLQGESSQSQSRSMISLLVLGTFILAIMLAVILGNYFTFSRPISKLYDYVKQIGQNKSVPASPPHFKGVYAEIQNVIHQLSHTLEMYVRDRHKFILDVVEDFKLPLSQLQAGKFLLGDRHQQIDEDHQAKASESVRRGLAIFSGSLEDLNDIVEFNRLESKLDENTVDLCELVGDAARTLVGVDFGEQISIQSPPIPLWVQVDKRRFSRMLVQIFSRVITTLADGGKLAVSLSHSTQGAFRGVEILIYDLDRVKGGRSQSGPEQDLLKHWISEKGLSMTLVHKVVKSHGGTITAAGVMGTSVSIAIRLPYERIVSRGLISRPSEDSNPVHPSLVVQRPSFEIKDKVYAD